MKTSSALPTVTVILPVRNEGAYIERSLGSVLEQDYPRELVEVIVADGMSTDGTRGVVRKMAAAGANVRLIDNPGKIVPVGMNLALRAARGEVIVRVDGHCVIAPDYISRCVHHLREKKVDGVGGPIDTVGETPVAQAIAAAMSSKFGVGGSAFRTAKGQTTLADTVAFPAYTREAIRRAGLYDEELVRNQDDEYNYRIRKLGGKVLLASDVRSEYYSRSSLRSLWRQYYQYGYWKVRVMQKHPKQMSARQFAPPALVAASLLSAAAATTPVGPWPLAAVLGAYVISNLSAALLLARKAGWKLLPLLPAVFSILHYSYGTGFLVGMFKFSGRWNEADRAAAPSGVGT